MKIHFIGIGGIGVSALARYYLAQGFEVSGSDVAESEILEELKKSGAKIPPNPPFIKGGGNSTDLVIYSAAVPDDNPELVEARQRGIKCQTYAQALGELTKKYFTIAVSGTHGKSTTTAMIGLILEAAGLDPTVIVGTKVRWNLQNPPQPSPASSAGQALKGGREISPPLGGVRGDFESASNFRMGRSKYLVIEADEYAASFLNYWPKIIVLTNIEEDHLDYYKDLKHIMETFKEYVGHLSGDGVLVANEEDENVMKLVKSLKFKVKSYSSKLKIEKLNLRLSGKHNISNAMAALAAARALGVDDKISIKALNEFSGTWRRMEYKGEVNGAKIYDDYGHHPTEIKATLQGARELLAISHKPLAKLWCVFQPHQYQRTYKLFDHFIGSFADADKVILLPIYSVAGREKESIKKKVNSEMLTLRLRAQGKPEDVLYIDSFNKAAKHLKKNLKVGDICVIMGAGDICKLTERLICKNPRPRQTCPV